MSTPSDISYILKQLQRSMELADLHLQIAMKQSGEDQQLTLLEARRELLTAQAKAKANRQAIESGDPPPNRIRRS